MTHWGYALLLAFVALGLSPVSWRKAGRLAVLVTLAAMSYAFHSYGVL
jgi:hypothetical protein